MANCETEGHIWDGRPGRDFSCEKCGAPYSVRGPVDAKGGDEGYIAVVPDHCDTIAWRGAYHSLPIPTDPAGVSEMADWWKPNPGDPFWMLEAPDGEWLANEHSLLGTRDAATAIRFPSESHARNHKARMKAGTKWWDAKPTEHKWIERALHASPSTDELVEALVERLREGVKEIGLHEDNNTELFDIDGANEVMWEAANALATLSPSHDSRLADDLRGHSKYELEAALEVAKEALGPFARAGDVKLCGEWQDDERFGQTDVNFYLTFGDLRRAAAALQTIGAGR